MSTQFPQLGNARIKVHAVGDGAETFGDVQKIALSRAEIDNVLSLKVIRCKKILYNVLNGGNRTILPHIGLNGIGHERNFLFVVQHGILRYN